MSLRPAQRIVISMALEDNKTGFVSEKEMTLGQIGTARQMARFGLLKRAGEEPDGSKVYQVTPKGAEEFGSDVR